MTQTLSRSLAADAEEFVLDNGLKVVLQPVGAAPVATVLVLYRVGSRNEAVGHTGAAHLLEHMLFKGTPRFNLENGGGYMHLMDQVGASLNANTWMDRTQYFQTLPSEYVPFALELEADRMCNAIIAEEARRSEMTVVRNEFELGESNPSRVLYHAVSAAAYSEHPYHHPIIGWRTDVENMTADRLRAFYRSFYRPDNATLFVTGSFDTAAVRDAVQSFFAPLRNPDEPLSHVHTSEPPQLGERSITIKWPGETTMFTQGYRAPGVLGQRYVLPWDELVARASDPQALRTACAFDALGHALTGGPSARLGRRLVDGGLALGVHADFPFQRDPYLFSVGAAVRPGIAHRDVAAEIDAELASISRDGITSEELTQAKRATVVSRAQSMENSEGVAFTYSMWESLGGWRLHENYARVFEELSPDDVRAVVNEYIDENSRTLAAIVPGTARRFTIPEAPVIARDDAAEPFPETQLAPAPARLPVSRFADRIVRGTLSNGIVWNLVRNDSAPTVRIRGLIESGLDSPARSVLGVVTSWMLSRGTLERDRQEIANALRDAGAWRSYSVDDPSGNPLAFRFSAGGLVSDLPLAIQTVGEELAQPAFPESELELVRAELSGDLRVARTDTGKRALTSLLQVLFPFGHAQGELSIDDRLSAIEAITVDSVRGYYDELVRTGRVVISCSGNVRAEQLEALLESALCGLSQTAQPRKGTGTQAAGSLAKRVFTEIEHKANTDIVAGSALSWARSGGVYEAARLANNILGRHAVTSRLADRLRGREGLTYGITSRLAGLSSIPGYWMVRCSVNRANVERAIESMQEVMRGYAETGPTAREIEAEKNSTLGRVLVGMNNNAGIANMLEEMEYFNLGHEYVDTLRERLSALTPQAVHAAVKACFDPNQLAIAVAGSP